MPSKLSAETVQALRKELHDLELEEEQAWQESTRYLEFNKWYSVQKVPELRAAGLGPSREIYSQCEKSYREAWIAGGSLRRIKRARVVEIRNALSARDDSVNPPKLCWNMKNVDLAELCGILFKMEYLTVPGSKVQNNEEFFRRVAQVFVRKNGKNFTGHSLTESFRRLSCIAYGRKKKASHFPGLQKDLLNSTKSKR